MVNTPDEAKALKHESRARGSIYIAPWVKVIAVLLAVALFFAGLFALITAQAVWNADVKTLGVTVCGADGTTLTLPGLSYDGALYVNAQAYDAASAVETPDAQAVSHKYWGDELYYELTENGGLKEN
jgi:hypothetical protein